MRILHLKIFVAVLAPLVLFALLEGALWVVGYEPLTDDEAFQAAAKHTTCKFEFRGAAARCNAASLESDRPQIIVTLGGSSAAGFPMGHTKPFSLHLQRLLDRRQPGRWQVWNRASYCKDTLYVRDCGLAALEAAPSHLIVYAGHNDFNNWGFDEPGRLIALEENSWVYALDHRMAQSRVYSLLIRRIRPLEQKSIRERIILPEPDRSARARAIILAKTEENLTRLVEAAADRGTIVVLLTVVSNLDEFPHTRDEWDVEPAKLVERRPEFVIWREAFEQGIAADRRGEYEAALVAFKRARDIYQQGRAHSELNDLLRALAARYENTRLVDFEATLDRISRGEGIGCNYFGDERYCDQFHPNARSQMRIAEALLPALLEDGP